MISQLFAVDCKVESKMHKIGLPLEQEDYTTTTDHFYNAFDQDW